MLKQAITFLMAWVFLALMVPMSQAEERYKVAIVVGNDAISTFDIFTRMKMALITTGITPSPDVQKRLLPQISQVLIDEALYRQEGARLGISVSDKELAKATELMETQLKLPAGSLNDFLKKNGIPRSNIENQLRAQVVWSKIVRKEIQPKVVVGDSQVKEMEEFISSSASGTSEVHISEIVLPVEEAGKDNETRQLAANLIEEIQKGTAFESVAREFSRSGSAEKGGDIGWVQLSELDRPLEAAVEGLQEGDATAPIRTKEAYVIIKLHDRKSVVKVDPKETEIVLDQIFIPLASGEKEKIISSHRKELEKVRENIKVCADFDKVKSQLPAAAKVDKVTLQMKSLHPDIYELVNKLNVGQLSDVAQSSAGLHLLMVCERTRASVILPDKDRIRTMLMNKQLELEMRRYISNMRRKAFIEVRM